MNNSGKKNQTICTGKRKLLIAHTQSNTWTFLHDPQLEINNFDYLEMKNKNRVHLRKTSINVTSSTDINATSSRRSDFRM